MSEQEQQTNTTIENEQVKDVKAGQTTASTQIQSAYSKEVKELAQSKVFKVEFGEGENKYSKNYLRRKALMGEVIQIENKRQIMSQANGTPLEISQTIYDFYWYSTQIHLRETKTNKPMLEDDFKQVVFEDFKKIVDACEFVMLFGVPN